jgi:hypothetical protein
MPSDFFRLHILQLLKTISWARAPDGRPVPSTNDLSSFPAYYSWYVHAYGLNYPRVNSGATRDWAAILRAVAARFFTVRVFTYRTFPPLMRLSGHKPTQDANAEALAKRERSGPISANSVRAERAFTPGTCVKSTPNIRYK